MSNQVNLECSLQFGPTSSDYVRHIIGSVHKTFDYVDESYLNVSAQTTLDLSDMSTVGFVLVEVLAGAGGASYVTLAWTDKTEASGQSSKIYTEDGMWTGFHSTCATNPDPAQAITITPDAGNVDVRVIVAGDL